MMIKTRKEKIVEAFEEAKRIAKITFITLIGCVIIALGVNYALTMRENRELKETVNYYEMERESMEKESRDVNDQVIRYYLYLTEG